MRRSTENGFVLVSALWLLLLGAALAASLMLRSMTAARELRINADRATREHAIDDAIETIAADLVFNGQRSRWAQLPATTPLNLDGQTLMVTASAEDVLPDVNQASLRLLDRAMQDHGLLPAERAGLLTRIVAARTRQHRIASYPELASLGAGILPPGEEICLASMLSPFGGSGSTMSGFDAVGGGGSNLRAGSVLRILLVSGSMRRVAAMRLVAANDHPYGLLGAYDDDCTRSAQPGVSAA